MGMAITLVAECGEVGVQRGDGDQGRIKTVRRNEIDRYQIISNCRCELHAGKIARFIAQTRERALSLGELKFVDGAWFFVNPRDGTEVDLSQIREVSVGRSVEPDGYYQTTQVSGTNVSDLNYYFNINERSISRMHLILAQCNPEERTAGRVVPGFEECDKPFIRVTDLSLNGTFICVKRDGKVFSPHVQADYVRFDLDRILEHQVAGTTINK